MKLENMRALIFVVLWLAATVCHAGLVWSATEIPPEQITKVKANDKLLEATIFEAPEAHSVYLDKAWHGIHYLLTESAESNNTLASKVIMGGESIGPDFGYGPAQLLTPDEVKEVAKLLKTQTAEALSKRYDPSKLRQAGIYPEVIWEREKDGALKYLLDYYSRLVAFYEMAAEKGYAVILSIH